MKNGYSNNAKQWIIAVIVVGLVYALFNSFNQGIADIYKESAVKQMQSWEGSGHVIDSKQWDQAFESIHQALKHYPNNPEYYSLLGRLYQWKVYQRPINSRIALENFQQALDYYHQSLAVRPSYAFDWANVALMKSRLSEVDTAFYSAVNKAWTYGQWEPEIQLKLADALLSVWYLLDDKHWNQLVTIVEQGLASYPKEIMRIASQVKVLNKLCGKLRRTEIMLTYC